MPRQKLIIYFFAFLAALGLGLYLLLPAGSEVRLLGIVLMIFCLPLVVRQALRRVKIDSPALHATAHAGAPAAMPATVPTYGPREVNLTLEAIFSQIVETRLMRVDQVDGDILDLPCLLALGTDGFRARLWRADKITGPWSSGETLILHAEFLMPERALPRFPVDMMARVQVDTTVLGIVKVLRHHAREGGSSTNPA